MYRVIVPLLYNASSLRYHSMMARGPPKIQDPSKKISVCAMRESNNNEKHAAHSHRL